MKKTIILSILTLLSIIGVILGFVFENHISIIFMVSLFMFAFAINLYDRLRKKPMESLILYIGIFGILSIFGLWSLSGMGIFVLILMDAYIVFKIYEKKGELY